VGVVQLDSVHCCGRVKKPGLLIGVGHGRIMPLERWCAVGVASAHDEI
jgi:hypothetical protein